MISSVKAALKSACGPRFFSTKSYAQEGEDLVIGNLFERRPTGFYVEVGCHHPFRFSNTFTSYQKGWSGICIDPLPGTKKIFKKWRPRDICVEKGVSTQTGMLKYYMFNEPALNTFDEALAMARNGSQGYRLVEVRSIATLPLSQVLDSVIADPKRIDYFSIDVEGLDLEVLKSNDWNRYRPEVVIAECLNLELDRLDADPVAAFMLENGYRVCAKTGRSVFFRDGLSASEHR
jgi:FkbM family methyltransferase